MPRVNNSYIRGRDWGRTSDPRMPKNYISAGTVGHTNDTASYVRVEDGDVLVEVTLSPAGDEIVARLDMTAVDGGGIYMPISYGQRVIIAFPGGADGNPTLIGRLNDSSWPFPSSVSGVSTGGGNAPMFAFYKTQDGQLFAIETGDGGDIIIQSGASLQTRVSPSEQILLTGQTHIGPSVDFTEAPTGSTVGANGTVTTGTAGTNFVPTPNTNTTIPPPLDTSTPPVPLPADGVFRIKDTVQSNVTTDAAYWAYTNAITAFIAAWATETTAAGLLAPLYPTTLTAATAVATAATSATTLTSQPASGSKNTVDDG